MRMPWLKRLCPPNVILCAEPMKSGEDPERAPEEELPKNTRFACVERFIKGDSCNSSAFARLPMMVELSTPLSTTMQFEGLFWLNRGGNYRPHVFPTILTPIVEPKR